MNIKIVVICIIIGLIVLIGVKDGLVKYEPVDLLDLSPEYGIYTKSGNPIFRENDESKILGLFLVQMIDEQTIKVEIFLRKTVEGVNGFTENANIYIR